MRYTRYENGKNAPTRSDTYLCTVICPNGQGGYIQQDELLYYEVIGESWQNCNDVIVVSWMPVPEDKEYEI